MEEEVEEGAEEEEAEEDEAEAEKEAEAEAMEERKRERGRGRGRGRDHTPVGCLGNAVMLRGWELLPLVTVRNKQQ